MSTSAEAPSDITEKEVNAAQQAWCDGLIEICRAYPDGEYKKLAGDFIDRMYDFEKGRVFFRPTLALNPNFRTTRKGALAYFIGEDDEFPDDDGFIKKGWDSARYDNNIDGSNAIQIFGNIAMTMGNVYLRQQVTIGGDETVVDKVFAYRKDETGALRLIVHKSALTNRPPPVEPES
jgi:hypothetical protein